MIATPNDWKRLPFEAMVRIPYRDTFTAAQYGRLSRGLVPQAMEDKWFIYLDGSDLCFHRSWTGHGIFRVSLSKSNEGYAVVQALCVSHLASQGGPYQVELVDFLIRNLLLGEARPFPRPADIKEQLPDAYQYAISGTGYRETIVTRRPWWKFWG